MRSAHARAEHGFALVEALVALTIVALAAVVTLEVGALTLRTQAAAERHLDAVVLAQARLDQLLVLPTESLEAYGDSRWQDVSLSRPYRWHALVRPEPDAQGLWRAAVAIEGTDVHLTVETLFYRPGRARRRELQQ